jgi:hypothetical protein
MDNKLSMPISTSTGIKSDESEQEFSKDLKNTNTRVYIVNYKDLNDRECCLEEGNLMTGPCYICKKKLK